MYCANTSALNAYMAEQDRADKRAEWVETEAEAKYEQMLPLSQSDLDEAVSEVMADKKRNKYVVAAFADGDDAELGAALREAVKDYWMAVFTEQAEDDYDDGAAQCDYGRF
jgi:hypothetical protein